MNRREFIKQTAVATVTMPTLLQVAGGDPTRVDTGRAGAPDGGSGFDGRSFWHLVAGNGNHHRDYVYGAYTNRGVRDGTDYPIRSVRSKRYKYIANETGGCSDSKSEITK